MIPTITANGAEIPAIGLGTWQLNGDVARNAVSAALDAGYRHIDTAAMYGNEAEVGEAIRSHATPRANVFITTKVWPTDVAAGRLLASAKASLKRLRMEAVDLLLIHWPSPNVPVRDQVRALCEARKQGLCRHVGISNFSSAQVEEAVRSADESIVTNQIEHHPFADRSELFATCARHGISVTSYSPLAEGAVFRDPVIAEIARAKGRTPAQIVLRWHMQHPQNIAIPKSRQPKRLAENIAIFDFTLTADEMAKVTALARGRRR